MTFYFPFTIALFSSPPRAPLLIYLSPTQVRPSLLCCKGGAACVGLRSVEWPFCVDAAANVASLACGGLRWKVEGGDRGNHCRCQRSANALHRCTPPLCIERVVRGGVEEKREVRFAAAVKRRQ